MVNGFNEGTLKKDILARPSFPGALFWVLSFISIDFVFVVAATGHLRPLVRESEMKLTIIANENVK